ncbi:centromere protein W [Alosa sapidissima]|uniref:centromere protein W n=1 Tax=Alosa sapidissima TaxID=34773 RepID=UPI001C084226|nr:centromere protein W [Alosa sapidissima]
MPNKIPRKAIKDILKEKTNMRIGANADLMVQLDMLLFLHRLAEEARAKAFEEKSATIKAHHVQAVSKKLLKSVRG